MKNKQTDPDLALAKPKDSVGIDPGVDLAPSGSDPGLRQSPRTVIQPNQADRSVARRPFWQILLIVLGCMIAIAIAWGAVILPSLVRSLSEAPQVGQVTAQDFRSPVTTSYPSQVLTEIRRETAARAVQPVYTSPDTSVARQQLEHLRSALAYISSVRADGYASINQKLDDLAALEDANLSQETALSILRLGDSRWQIIQQEALLVLERVMSATIRPDNLQEALSRVPSLVSLSLPEDQVVLVSELVRPFVLPNSEYSESLTEAARQEARELVEPVSRSFVAGQTIIQQGQVITESDLEALEKLGLIETQIEWQELVGPAVLVLLMGILIVLSLQAGISGPRTPRRTVIQPNQPGATLKKPGLADSSEKAREDVSYKERQGWVRERYSLVIIIGLFLVFLILARWIIPTHTVIPYAFPLTAFGLSVTALFGSRLALIFSIPLAILVAYGLPNSLDLMLYYIVSSITGILVLGEARRVASFFWAGAAIAVSGSLVIFAFRLTNTDLVGIGTLIGAAFFNGLATASLTILLQIILAMILGKTTPMQLMDLTRPDHPLLQFILREAPGTYQHSLQLANLVEQAAERIGADALLTRVGALYHDAGKALNPVFFIENQVPGYPNPHNDLDPVTSASYIIQHVKDGMELGAKYRLPRSILDFIAEHHGTMLTQYQYVKALKAADGDESQVVQSKFRYPGPRPQSRETAILMLADGCEARMRAERPRSEDELRSMIKEVVDDRVSDGQLDNTQLTLQDLDTIVDSFTATLKGIYHPRIKYPRHGRAGTSPDRAGTGLKGAPGSDEETVPIPGGVSYLAMNPSSQSASDVPVTTSDASPQEPTK